jgi:cold-inducible RNA-binding protein
LKNIFVGNLDFGATEAAVRSWFEEYGTVDRVQIITDRDTGRSRGFAFVEMADAAEADRAIESLNGASVNGRSLNVNVARPRENGRGAGGNSGSFRQRRQSRW